MKFQSPGGKGHMSRLGPLPFGVPTHLCDYWYYIPASENFYIKILFFFIYIYLYDNFGLRNT